MKYFFALLLLLLVQIYSVAQNTQTIKGIITDKASEKPLTGATVQVLGTSLSAGSDANGRYTITGIAPGRLTLAISYIGYKPVTLPEVLVTSGKEVVIDIALEQSIAALNEVRVTASRTKKGAATNEYATASSRSFSIEEVTRFSGGRNDPSKLVSNFAGVISNNDSRNDIVVRGNSPSGVLWRIEGIPSPSPNHYSAPGTTGGPVTALNTNALRNSDFLSSAFPAEYGNATAAVFDINFRNGNTDKHERTLQLNAFSGLEAMIEGPLGKRKTGGAYLIGYRYSFAQIAKTIGLNIGTGATPKYQDWVFNFTTAKGKAGKFNFFGMGGVSTIDFIGKDLDSSDFYSRQDQDAFNKNYVLHFGAKHTLDLNKKSYLRSAITFSAEKSDFDVDQYELPLPPYNKKWLITSSRNKTQTIRFSSYVNTKVNAKLNWRAGFTGETYHFTTKVIDREGRPDTAPFDVFRDFDDRFFLLQYFAQAKYKPADKLTFTAGLHGMYFTFNQSSIIEPRAAVNYQITNNDAVYFGYGLHGQLQPFPVYLFEAPLAGGGTNRGNRNLDFSKAHHLVLGYEKRFLQNWRVKAEAYYQRLFDVPAEQTASGFSMLNAGNDFTFPNKAGLVNTGTGKNLGVELTIEKFLNNGWYILATTSLFDSKYKGSDGVERNSAFNYGYVFNFLSGAEWKTSKYNAFTFDMKFSAVGGRYATPVNLAASIATGKEILDESRYNAERLSGYMRLDTKIGYRMNSKRKKFSQTFYLDFQNVTNKQNVFLRRYNALKGTIGEVNQLGFFPDIMYKVQF
jgi:TonB dependent receptor/CarboxypepD_reg-like domain/TonB-dependent Receptor Plug Domain